MYVRFTKLTFKPENYHAMISYRDNFIIPKLNEMQIPGLIRVRMFRASEGEVITLAGYDTKESYEAAAEMTGEMMMGLAEWLISPPEQWVGELEDLYETER